MRRILIKKTNRKVPESVHMIACKECEGVLGYVEVGSYLTVDDITNDFYLDCGSNLYRKLPSSYTYTTWWTTFLGMWPHV